MMSFDDFQYNNINPYIFDLNYHDKELKEMIFSKISQLFSEVPNLNAPINF